MSSLLNANESIGGLAQAYNSRRGFRRILEGVYVDVDVSQARRIADAYDVLPADDFRNPEVYRCYSALAIETNQQWDFAVKMGSAFEPWRKADQPYANSAE